MLHIIYNISYKYMYKCIVVEFIFCDIFKQKGIELNTKCSD